MSTKIIFDTDPGIDDAMAILFAEKSSAVELIGITTVVGNAFVETCTRNALYLKERFNLNAPVYQGAARPLVVEQGQPPYFVHGDNGFGNVPVPEPTISAEAGSAAQFIVDTVLANPGEITLVAVGRMTNLALALRLCPEITQLVKSVVIMGGALGVNGHSGNVTPVAEANIIGDPHAADIVFRAGWPLTMVGLDVTKETMMDVARMERIRDNAGEAGRFLYDISRFYQSYYHDETQNGSFPVHDASALAYVMAPELFTVQKGPIRAVTEGIAIGQTIMSPEGKRFAPNEWDATPSKQACIGVDAEAVLNLYEQTLCAP